MPFKLIEGTVNLSIDTDIVYFVLGLLTGASACAFFFLLFLGGF
jgi:hypothetical protein